jgi:hypothetical protein
MQLTNKGKNLLQPKGEINVRGWNVDKKLSILPQYVLSNSQRILQIDNTITNSCENCPDTVTTILKGTFVGKYTISTSVSFYQGSPTLYATTSFIALPFKLIGVLALLLVFLGAIYFLLGRK